MKFSTRPCTKKKFFSESTALKCIEHVQKQRKKNKSRRNVNIIAAYKCPYCHFWHTTSQEQRR